MSSFSFTMPFPRSKQSPILLRINFIKKAISIVVLYSKFLLILRSFDQTNIMVWRMHPSSIMSRDLLMTFWPEGNSILVVCMYPGFDPWHIHLAKHNYEGWKGSIPPIFPRKHKYEVLHIVVAIGSIYRLNQKSF